MNKAASILKEDMDHLLPAASVYTVQRIYCHEAEKIILHADRRAVKTGPAK